MLQIAQNARIAGHEVITYSKYWKKNPIIKDHHYIGSAGENLLNRIVGPIVEDGCTSILATTRLIRKLDAFSPEVIHLHNLHGWYLNYGMLFHYIKKNKIRVIWTLHDCWPFTGQCPHFDMVSCDKWKAGCHHCPQFREYPAAVFDRTDVMWKKKRGWFTGVEDMTIVTPSFWLAALVKQSFLQEYPVRVIHNGIDLDVFRPTSSSFKERYGISEGVHIVLGVASAWGRRKGLDVFIELAKVLDDSYKIVLVGTDKQIDKQLPEGILSIHCTYNQQELAEIYTVADVFVNPTREDNFPTVNLEAIACGTPVVTFNTGGSPECIDDTCGCVVKKDDIGALVQKIQWICTEKPFSEKSCIRRAENFHKKHRFEEYVKLYEK